MSTLNEKIEELQAKIGKAEMRMQDNPAVAADPDYRALVDGWRTQRDNLIAMQSSFARKPTPAETLERSRAVAQAFVDAVTRHGGPSHLTVWQREGLGTRIYFPAKMGYLTAHADGTVTDMTRGQQTLAVTGLFPAWRKAIRAALQERRTPVTSNAGSERPTYTPPADVAAAARRGLEQRAAQPPSNRCCTPVGLRRAVQLANRQPVSARTIARMAAYFARHAVDAKGAGWREGTSKGRQAWDCWGGDAGNEWAREIMAKMSKKNSITLALSNKSTSAPALPAAFRRYRVVSASVGADWVTHKKAWLYSVQAPDGAYGNLIPHGGKYRFHAQLDLFRNKGKKAHPSQGSLFDQQLSLLTEAMFREADKPILGPDSPKFKAWFGKSHVVDDQGKPLIVYHGTSKAGGFSIFRPKAVFFVPELKVAKSYVSTYPKDRDPTPPLSKVSPEASTENKGIYPVYLRIEKPLIVDGKGARWDEIPFEGNKIATDSINVIAKDRGYDGVIFRQIRDYLISNEGKKPHDVYTVFSPYQIKSAVVNTGEYSRTDPDIRHNPRKGRRNPPAPGYDQKLGSGTTSDAWESAGADPDSVVEVLTHISKKFNNMDASRTIIILARNKLADRPAVQAFLPKIAPVRIDKTTEKGVEFVYRMPRLRPLNKDPGLLNNFVLDARWRLPQLYGETLASAATRLHQWSKESPFPLEYERMAVAFDVMAEVAKSVPFQLTRTKVDTEVHNLAVNKTGHLVLMDPLLSETDPIALEQFWKSQGWIKDKPRQTYSLIAPRQTHFEQPKLFTDQTALFNRRARRNADQGSDVARHMLRLRDPSKAPQAAPGQVGPLLSAGTAPSYALEAILAHIRAGGYAWIPQYGRSSTLIDRGTLARWEKTGDWLIKQDGAGYRVRSGRASVLVPPLALQLGVAGVRRNGDVLTGKVVEGPDGEPSIRTLEKQPSGKRKVKFLHVPHGVVDWRRDLAHPPRKLSQPIGLRDSPLVTHEDGEALSDAILPNGNVIQVAWRVVDLSDLVVSHDPWSLSVNKAYPQELQPRDRSRKSYHDQIGRLVATWNPSAVMWSATASDGAPIVGPDGVVESGNGRTIALSRIYDKHPESADRYRRTVRQWAKELGLTIPSHLAKPVLVRVRLTDIDRAEFARLANVSGMQQMAAGEQALADSAQMTSDLVRLLNPDKGVGAAANAGFVDLFIAQVAGKGARGTMINEKGVLSKEGEIRIDLAIFAFAYGPSAGTFITELAEVRESELRTVLQGLLNGAMAVAQLRAGIAQGVYYSHLDPSPGLVDLADLVRRAKITNVPIDTLLKQGTLHEPISDEAKAWLSALRPKGKLNAVALGDTIVEYCKLVELTPANVADMFGAPPPTCLALIARARAVVQDEGVTQEQNVLFNRRRRWR